MERWVLLWVCSRRIGEHQRACCLAARRAIPRCQTTMKPLASLCCNALQSSSSLFELEPQCLAGQLVVPEQSFNRLNAYASPLPMEQCGIQPSIPACPVPTETEGVSHRFKDSQTTMDHTLEVSRLAANRSNSSTRSRFCHSNSFFTSGALADAVNRQSRTAASKDRLPVAGRNARAGAESGAITKILSLCDFARADRTCKPCYCMEVQYAAWTELRRIRMLLILANKTEAQREQGNMGSQY